MSPEQLRNESADARSDIHALGAVIYEMATGRRAFPENQGPPLVDAVLNRPPVTPRAFNPHLSPELERIVLKCLEKDPDQRYQSAREAAIDLERLKSHGAHATTPTTIGWRRAGAFAAVVVALGIVGALALDVGGWRDRAFGGGARPRIESLAVLPLQNLSGDREREYFADGMTDALITELSRIRALKVISRTSVMPCKGAGKSLTQIASELGVDGVIEGSVLHDGDQVRIAVQLIQGATDRHLWSDSYQREVGSVLALQNDVARAVAREIRVALTPEDEQRLASMGSVNREAYHAYLKGLQYADQQTDEGQRRSIDLLERAVQLDPQFALAHGRLAVSYATFYMGGGLEPREFYPKAKTAALRALEIDNTVAEASVALGRAMLYYVWNWPEAERQYRRAIELNPSNALPTRATPATFTRSVVSTRRERKRFWRETSIPRRPSGPPMSAIPCTTPRSTRTPSAIFAVPSNWIPGSTGPICGWGRCSCSRASIRMRSPRSSGPSRCRSGTRGRLRPSDTHMAWPGGRRTHRAWRWNYGIAR